MKITVKGRSMLVEICRRVGLGLIVTGVLFASEYTVRATVAGNCNFSDSLPASELMAELRTAGNQFLGYGFYQVYRNGNDITESWLYPPEPQPNNTVFTVYLRDASLGTMTKLTTSSGQEVWRFYVYPDGPSQIGNVGDTMSIKKNGEPYISGVFKRRPYYWANILGTYYNEGPQGFPIMCSISSGYIYLGDSPSPGRLAIRPRVWSNSPVTRITVNGPGSTPGQIGPEIANVPLLPPGPSIPPPPGWMITGAQNDNIQLNAQQFGQLLQGKVSTNVFTQNDPGGFSQIDLTVYYINVGGDYEGDGKADFAVFRPTDQTWYVLYSSNNVFQAIPFGRANDKLIVGDYDHDGKTDLTMFQTDNPDYPGLGVWQIRMSSTSIAGTVQWGLSSDIPIALDIDGNNTSDIAVFRPSTGTWYIRKMGDIIKPRYVRPEDASEIRIIPWGMAGDKPLAGDFNADGRDELAVFRPSDGNWYIYDDLTGEYRGIHWGMSGDIPIARDFDGDARADLAVFRPSNGTWYISSSISGETIIRHFGTAGDVPVPSDFDKDGVSDIAVFRPSDGNWYITRSSDNVFYSVHFGLNGDIPPMAYR